MEYVWYASYGSNLNQDRFLCYIRGGQPEGSKDVEAGCRDQSLPQLDQSILLPFPLYFAEDSERWGGAPAFLGHQIDEDNPTYGRMYKITKEQFLDIVKQENGGIELKLNLKEVKREGAKTFLPSWYGRIVYVRDYEGLPIFTFTAPWTYGEAQISRPSKEYLTTIIRGIKECYVLQDSELVRYFIEKPGVKGSWSESELSDLIKNCD